MQTEWDLESDAPNVSSGLVVHSLCDLKEVRSINTYYSYVFHQMLIWEIRIEELPDIGHVLKWEHGLMEQGKLGKISHIFFNYLDFLKVSI